MPRGGRIRRLQEIETQPAPGGHDIEEEEMVGESSHHHGIQQENVNDEEQLLAKIAQGVAVGMRMLRDDPENFFRIERLKALGATTYFGTADPADAEAWMELLEKCFDVMGCPEDRKVRLATFLLQEGANDWWKLLRGRRSESELIEWSEFKKAFYNEYYPRSYKDGKRSEFLKLVQGSMTVAEYHKKYVELSKYAANIIEDEIDRCKRFEDGLREEIRTSTTAFEWNEFGKLVEAALRVEKSISERKSQREPSKNVRDFSTGAINSSGDRHMRGSNKSFAPGVVNRGSFKTRHHGSSSPRSNSNTSSQTSKSSNQPSRPSGNQRTWQQGESVFNYNKNSACQRCGKFHQGQCMWGTYVCYNCGQTGHLRRECPQLLHGNSVSQGASSRPVNQGQSGS